MLINGFLNTTKVAQKYSHIVAKNPLLAWHTIGYLRGQRASPMSAASVLGPPKCQTIFTIDVKIEATKKGDRPEGLSPFIKRGLFTLVLASLHRT